MKIRISAYTNHTCRYKKISERKNFDCIYNILSVYQLVITETKIWGTEKTDINKLNRIIFFLNY